MLVLCQISAPPVNGLGGTCILANLANSYTHSAHFRCSRNW